MERISETVRRFPVDNYYCFCPQCDRVLMDKEDHGCTGPLDGIYSSHGDVYYCVQCDSACYNATKADVWLEEHSHVRAKTVPHK